MSASVAMALLTLGGVVVSLALWVVAGLMGDAAGGDAFVRAALAVGIGGLGCVAAFWWLEVRGGVRAGRQSRPEAVRGRRRDT